MQISTIDKLGKDNFDFWKLPTEFVLIKNDYWNYVTSAPKRPDADSTDEMNWIQKNKKARADIM